MRIRCSVGYLEVTLLAMVALCLFLLSCGDKGCESCPPGDGRLTGLWLGVAGGRALEMHLVETGEGRVEGEVILRWPGPTETLEIKCGKRPERDSVFLDVSCHIPPPMGCERFITGRIVNPDSAAGFYSGKVGHDPPWVVPWVAWRVRVK